MRIQKFGDGIPVKSLTVTRGGRTIKHYERCIIHYAVQNDCGIETEGFVVTKNKTEIFYARPNHYEAIA